MSAPEPNYWPDRYARARDFLVPWVELTVPLAGRTVLEYGCGHGPVSCAFAERAGRVIGVDIDTALVEEGRRRVTDDGVADRVELERHPVEEILDAVRARRGEVDVFLLYAVLEHLTLDERLAVLELAREVTREDGASVVCETPNRLIPFDHHTTRVPFMTMLGDELAWRYRDRSDRQDFLDAMAAAEARGEEEAREAWVRWGRDVSFHECEFELVFGDLREHVIASSYDVALFEERPIHAEELALARYLERVRPDLAPCFSRSWLDLVLTPRPHAPPRVPAAVDHGDHRQPGRGMDALGHAAGVRADDPTAGGAPRPERAGRRRGDDRNGPGGGGARRGGLPWPARGLRARGAPPRGVRLLHAPEPATEVELRVGAPGYITFVGHRAAGSAS